MISDQRSAHQRCRQWRHSRPQAVAAPTRQTTTLRSCARHFDWTQGPLQVQPQLRSHVKFSFLIGPIMRRLNVPKPSRLVLGKSSTLWITQALLVSTGIIRDPCHLGCCLPTAERSSMGRHRRTGNIGQTNLNQQRKELEQPEKERHFRQLHGPLLEDRERVVLHAKQKNRQRRAQWRLDLSPVERSHVGDASPHRRDLGSDVEAVLASKIEEVQRDRKTFKDEPWYRSPIGPGSKASVVLAALVQQDAQDTGYLAYSQIRQTLQSTNLGLSDKQTQQLLNKYDPNLVETSPIHYRTFVRHLHFADPEEKTDDVIFRQQTYLEKIRTHANHLLTTGTTLSASLGPFHAAPSPIQLSPLAKRTMLSVTNNEPDVVLGNPPEYSPSRLSPLEKHLPANDFDPFSFEHDKRRKELRAATKARILLNHIDRVQEYARHQDAAIVHHDHARLAAKAMHHHDHLSHVYDQEQHFLHRLENRGKALLHSEATRVNRNVSKDSMFY